MRLLVLQKRTIILTFKIKKMKTKKSEAKNEISKDLKKIILENSRKKAKDLADKIKRKYKKMPKAYRIMYLQHLKEVKELTPLEIVFFNRFINDKN